MHKSYGPPSNGCPKEPDMRNANESPRLKHTGLSKQASWFELPAPIRRLFDTFPLITYDDNALPQRSQIPRKRNTLHVFTSVTQVLRTNLSPNPACLKWQAYLLVNRIPFSVVSSNNHASPSGALPFMLPAFELERDPQPQAISSVKIHKWALSQGVREETRNLRLDAYMALVDVHIRNAWLYYLYLQSENFEAVAKRLYIRSASSNPLVQFGLAYQLRTAARDELLRTRSIIDEQEILNSADTAFGSLSALLGDEKFFSQKDSPGLFDLALFSYVHPLLALGEQLLGEADDAEHFPLRWQEGSLLSILQKWRPLLKHHENVFRLCSKT